MDHLPRRPPFRSGSITPHGDRPAHFVPTYAQICCVRAILKGRKLPIELALTILDYAHYWPEQTFTSAGVTVVKVTGGSSPVGPCLEARVLDNESSQKFGGEKLKVREIECEVKSLDQGSADQGRGRSHSLTSLMYHIDRYLPPRSLSAIPSILRTIGLILDRDTVAT